MTHSGIYARAELYDIAFDFRDVAAECGALLEIARRHGLDSVSRFLEVAAGPAAHAREMAGRGITSTALDLSPEMVALGLDRARAAGVDLMYLEADMQAFSLPEPVELAAILMDSLTCLLDNDAVLAHLEAMADALVPGGVYVLEMGHPRDVFRVGRSAGNDWEMERDGVKVHTVWGRDDDPFDPVTQITQVTVTVEWSRGDERGGFSEVAPERCFSPNEFRALVAASGSFDVVAELGAVDPDLPAGNSSECWRWVPVLRRRSRFTPRR